MMFTVNRHTLYADTGGKAFNPAQPTAVLIHGVLNDHSVWAGQTAALAGSGWNVLAIDLPGHGRSGGDAPASVQAAAQAVALLLDATGVEKAALVGHSWGSLIALEVAATWPERVSHLAMVGTAWPMAVSPALLAMSQSEPLKAIDMVAKFSHANAELPDAPNGLHAAARTLMQRLLASSAPVNIFHRGFKACNDYPNGLAAMARVMCPVLFVLGDADKMTPAKAAQGLVNSAVQGRVVMVPAGHQMMLEAPDAVLDALRGFLG